MLEARSDSLGEPALGLKLDEMFDQYVMAGQREAHEAARGDLVMTGTGPLIELF